MRRAALALAAAAALSGGPVAWAAMQHDHGSGPEVSIGFDSYFPRHLDVLTGQTVMWTNGSVRTHTVTAEDGAFDSGHIDSGGHFEQAFAAPGAHPYYCRIHPTIRGEVDAYDLLLDPLPGSTARGAPLTVSGTTSLPEGTTVSIEGDSGSGFGEVATAPVGGDGTFSAQVRPSMTTTYRAANGGSSSPSAEVIVVDRSVRALAARHGRVVVISAYVTPPSPGQTVVLKRRLRERFGWWPERRARLDSASQARFVIRTRGRVRARVVLTRADGATALARSAAVVVGAAR